MFDIGFWEIALIGVIALLVVGPERLPALARNVGLWVGRMRRYVAHVKDDIEREIHAEEVRKLIETPAHSITEFDDAISETRSVLADAERELGEVERQAQRLEEGVHEDDGAAEAGIGTTPAQAGNGEGPFAPANSPDLSPSEASGSGAAAAQAQDTPAPEAAQADDEQRHANS